jgi:hypothetical protein
MINILGFILLALIVIVCCFVAISHRKKKSASLKSLEIARREGIITSEELDSLKKGTNQSAELSIESCTVSAEEVMETVDSAIGVVNQLDRDQSYSGKDKWAQVFGIESSFGLSLKELTILSMKLIKPRRAIDLIAEILAMNIPIDAIEATQKQGKVTLLNYKAAARMIWVRLRERLSEPISIRKETHKIRKIPEKEILAEFTAIIIKSFKMPISAAGFAALIALIIGKIEFDAFSGEEQEDD